MGQALASCVANALAASSSDKRLVMGDQLYMRVYL